MDINDQQIGYFIFQERKIFPIVDEAIVCTHFYFNKYRLIPVFHFYFLLLTLH